MKDSSCNIRAFIAIPIEDKIKKALENTSNSIKIKDSKGISKVRTKTIHLTVRFLGDIDLASIEKVKSVLSQITKELNSFKLKSTGFKYLPSKHRLRTVAVGIEENSTLTDLFENINKSLIELEIVTSTQRQYTPHLTLFRTKSKGASTTLISSIDSFIESSKKEFKKLLDLEFKVFEVVLYKSTLTNEGAIHEPLATYKFKN